MKCKISVAVLAALAGPALATLELSDQLNVVGGGPGPVAASFESITKEVGYVVDNTFDGEITFRWTMKWDSFDGETAEKSWAMFHFFDAGQAELSGLGNCWGTSQVSSFNEAGTGAYDRSRQSGVEIEIGQDYTFKLVIDYHAGAPDTAVLTGGGFVDQPLAPGDWSFHHIRTRAGHHAPNQVDFTNMSITSSGIGGIMLGDPRFPSERLDASPAQWSWIPWVRIRQIEEEQEQLLTRIFELPQYNPKTLSDHLGYHSLFEDPSADAAVPMHIIEFTLRYPQRLDSIAFAPAFNPNTPGREAYAFPKRFKIDVLSTETGQFETVVNWMEEDFPNPGSYPVFFADIGRFAKQIRIAVPQLAGESGASYFALGEVYLFRRTADAGIGDNMAIWGPTGIEVDVSDSFSMTPQWDTQYLYDGIEGFGFPLSDKTVESEDLMVTYDEASTGKQVQLLLDLGRVEQVGRIDFWPASAPYLLALPSFGFPQKITVELSTDPDFETVEIFEVENASRSMYRGDLLSIITSAYKAQYIRISMEGLREYKGKRILGLGEISVSEYETVLSTNCKITALGIPDDYLDQLPRLVDGFSQQRRILSRGEWIKGLALRRPLDRRLAVVERELEQARVSWRLIQQRIGVWGGGAVFAGLILGMVLQRRQRNRVLHRLKWRIARDLHDDVGSNLGSISLVAERLEQDVQDEAAKEDLADLSLLAREASVSLRDVVWVIDQKTIRLPELMQKLAERAQRILSDVELVVGIPPDCPDMIVPLTFKRHLIMFFKEVVHNCARHANATQVQIAVSTKNQQLCVRVSDNGCGFDPAAQKDGWGLDSMQKRAQELGGTMKLESEPGQGTTVELTVPLKALLKNTDHLYKTSN